MAFKTSIVLLCLALLGPLLWPRIRVLSIFYKNAPERLQRMNALESLELKFEDRIRNCEDALLLEDKGLAILSCDPGREIWNTVMGIFYPGPATGGGLWLYDYASGADSLTSIELVGYDGDLHPLGLAYDDASSKLFVANHHTDGSRIDVFDLDLAGERSVAKHHRSIKHPLIHAPNSITLINSNEFYVTNDHHFLARQHSLLSRIETYSGIPGGSIVYADLSTDTARLVARLPFANGIEFLNETTLAVSATSAASVHLYDVDTATRDITARLSIKVPFVPDNLSVDKNGVLLVAGHPHPPSLTKFAESRALCNSEEGKSAEVCKVATAGTWISEWTAEGGRKDLFVDTWFPSGCTALRDVARKTGIITGLYAKGILVWKD
ncbi:hypothetical protein AK830_g1412 [Neonectria ditissima]|uniref:SMP-30/Gluconolactonase/LRE-like region domain-containing protein n=1 Tax=Neonectria ditissima TaxID=78410 RepID=A0A0P7BX30_9HYPO|nr:hypothetical protein AK830_g1412 [Neonectria ditissima]